MKFFGMDEDIPKRMDAIIQEVNQEEWEEASKETKELKQVWKKMIQRMQFSSERDEINDLNVSIERLRGAIDAQDQADALMEAYESKDHWESLGK